jgi:hypothetical protein
MRRHFITWWLLTVLFLTIIPILPAQPKNGLLLVQVLKGQPGLERICPEKR